MTDIQNVEGPIGPLPPPGKKSEEDAKPERFQEEMDKLKKQVRASDPEQQKQRKRQEESEMEKEVEPSSEKQPAGGQSTKGPSLFDIQTSEGKKSFTLAQTNLETSPPSSPMPTAPEASLGEEAGFGENENFLSNLPSAQLPQNEPSSASIPSPETPASTDLPITNSIGQTEQQDLQQKQSSQQQGTPSSSEKQGTSDQQSGKKGGQESILPSATEPSEEKVNSSLTSGTSAMQQAGGQGIADSPLETSEAFFKAFEQTALRPVSAEELVKKALESGITSEGASPPVPLISNSASQERSLKDEKQKDDQTTLSQVEQGAGASLSVTESFALEPPPYTTEPYPAYTALPPQIYDLFEKMVGGISVMMTQQQTTTILTLNVPSTSVLFGTQIIIEEYPTLAPKSFNVKILGSQQAVDLFEENIASLSASFQGADLPFRINRLETGYLSEGERPLFKRKEKILGDKEQEKKQDR